jgi:hypothetical protein
MLGLCIYKTSTFYKDLDLMTNAKYASIRFKNVQFMTRALIDRGNMETSEFLM